MKQKLWTLLALLMAAFVLDTAAAGAGPLDDAKASWDDQPRCLDVFFGELFTCIEAQPAVLDAFPGPGVTLVLSAHVTDVFVDWLGNEDVSDVSGRTVRFVAGSQRCTAVSDGNGIARCKLVPGLPGVVANLRYRADSFTRDGYLLVSDFGPLVRVGPVSVR